MSYVRQRRPGALIVSIVALVVALGGTAIAATQISGSRIMNRSIAGKKLKNHTITGKQIDLPKLGTVPLAKTAVFATSAQTARVATSAITAGSAANANNLGGAPAGAYEPRLQWALIRSDGAVLAQSGGITVDDASNGEYILNFGTSLADRPVSVTGHFDDPNVQVELSAAPCGGGPSSPVPGGVFCLFGGPNDANHLLVASYDTTGAPTAHGFWVSVGY